MNDISAGMEDELMLPMAGPGGGADRAHAQVFGDPATMDSLADYRDVVAEVKEYLLSRRDVALSAGILPHRILLDPGIGFAKDQHHNLQLLRRLAELRTLGQPLLLGTSRKRFIGRISGEDNPADRVMGTAASVGWCVAEGAAIVRVHDVAEMTKVVRVVRAILEIDN